LFQNQKMVILRYTVIELYGSFSHWIVFHRLVITNKKIYSLMGLSFIIITPNMATYLTGHKSLTPEMYHSRPLPEVKVYERHNSPNNCITDLFSSFV